MGKDSFTKPFKKKKALPKTTAVSSVTFDILRNLSIDIWNQSKLMEMELLSSVAFNKIVAHQESKLHFRKAKTTFNEEFETFLLPFKKKFAEKKLVINFIYHLEEK